MGAEWGAFESIVPVDNQKTSVSYHQKDVRENKIAKDRRLTAGPVSLLLGTDQWFYTVCRCQGPTTNRHVRFMYHLSYVSCGHVAEVR